MQRWNSFFSYTRRHFALR